ncbi:MAG TPA: thioredoxin-dependent thiol peroxidase [Polyangiaceae bacterium]|nr:thioredoxin-dependent thiol peroxidase [Polyangiaceae bacterium]
MAAKKKSAAAKPKSKANGAAKKATPAAKKTKPSKKAKPKPAKKTKAKPKPATKAKAKAKAKPKPAKKAPAPAAPKPAAKAKAALAPKAAKTAPAASNGLDAGSAAPAFDLSDEKGERVSSSSLAGKPYLLYFYPKDDTPGCTKEACDIRDNFGRFGQQGVRVLGVSPDSEQSHAKFGQKYGLPFTLLSDPDKTLANAYGVWGEKNNYGKKYMGIIRSSFLVGADGTVKKAYRGVRVDGHVAAVLEDAKTYL